MKRTIVALTACALVTVGGTAIAWAVGPPEIDEANASFQVSQVGTVLVRHCLGEDGIKYETLRGNWQGGETDLTPGSTDYNLGGALLVKGIVWTINLTTGRGVLKGSAVLTTPSTGATTYAGPLTLITQGVPAAGAITQARGFLDAATYTNNAADSGSLLANVEAQINGFSASGEFGNQTMNFQDFSVTTANKAC